MTPPKSNMFIKGRIERSIELSNNEVELLVSVKQETGAAKFEEVSIACSIEKKMWSSFNADNSGYDLVEISGVLETDSSFSIRVRVTQITVYNDMLYDYKGGQCEYNGPVKIFGVYTYNQDNFHRIKLTCRSKSKPCYFRVFALRKHADTWNGKEGDSVCIKAKFMPNEKGDFFSLREFSPLSVPEGSR